MRSVMRALSYAYLVGRVAAKSGDDKWVPRNLDAEWPAWVNGPSAMLEAYNIGLNGRGYRALVNLEQSLRKPANIVVLRLPKVKRATHGEGIST